MMRLRQATPEDAGVLGSLARKTFCETFTHYQPEALEAFLERYYNASEAAELISLPGAVCWIAEVDNIAVGYAIMLDYRQSSSPRIQPHLMQNACELKRLYVLQSHQKLKIGNALMQAAIAYASTEVPLLYLSVWSGNQKAIAFYDRHDFHKISEYEFYPPVGDVIDVEYILERKLFA